MKKISFKKTLVILLLILIVSFLFIFVILELNKKPEPKPEVVLPQPDNVIEDPYYDSLVNREDETSRIEYFTYNNPISIKETKKVSEEYEWVELLHEKLTLNDDTNIYLNDYLVKNNYSIYQVNDNTLRIEANEGSYILEIKKINSTPYDRVVGMDSINESNDLVNQYEKIKEEYFTIYSENEDKTAVEYGGIGTYSKMIDFINKNNLQKDIGLYTSKQVKEIIEKAYNITIPNNFGTVDVAKIKEKDIISNRIEKRQELSYKKDYLNIESYYLISDGTNVYACHLDYDLYIPSGIDFDNEVLFYFTNSIQLY